MSYADAGGVRIAYDDEGPRADDAVVFLGGWCGSGRSFFALLAERLAARHRVIRLDWRGHGDSGRPGADFGHDELADDAMAVIEASGVRRVVLVTQAHGGWPAIHLHMMLSGHAIPVHVDAPSVYHPLHEDDIIAMVPGLLRAATVPATVTGDIAPARMNGVMISA